MWEEWLHALKIYHRSHHPVFPKSKPALLKLSSFPLLGSGIMSTGLADPKLHSARGKKKVF